MKVVKSRIEYFSVDYDRRVLIIKEGNVIVGIDFMQGEEPHDFSDSIGTPSILKVYNATNAYLSGDTENECVNQAICIWFELINDGFRRIDND
jgi:hypothetical protein